MTRPLLLKVSEASFQSAVCDLATATGWRWCHFRPGRVQGGGWRTPIAGSPGWPDLMMCRGDKALFVELKAADGRVTPAQRAWLDALREAGLDARTWRPSDWDEITEVLTQPTNQETPT